MRIYTLLSIFFSLLFAAPVWGSGIVHDPAKRLYLQTEREPAGVVVPGQRVRLFYKLYTPSFFTDASFYQKPVVENGLLIEQPTLSGSASLAGKRMASQIIEIDLYPSQAGIIEIPDLRFIGKVADPGGETIPPSVLYSQPHVILVQTPPLLAKDPGFVASRQLTVIDEWKIPPGQLQVGDLLTRTLTLRAEKVPPMLLPDFTLNIPEGISLLMTEPSLNMVQSRLQDYSELKQVATYSIDTAGKYELGGEQIMWWKLADKPRVENINLATKIIDAGGFVFPTRLVLVLLLLFISVIAGYLFWRRLDHDKYRLAKELRGASPEHFVGLAYRWFALYGKGMVVLRELDPRIVELYRQLFSATGEKLENWKKLRQLLFKKLMGKG